MNSYAVGISPSSEEGRWQTINFAVYLTKDKIRFIIYFKICFDTSEIIFMLYASRTQKQLYIWVPWSILVGNRKLIYLMIMLNFCRTQKPLICFSSMFHNCRTQETLICLSFSVFVGHKIPAICLCSMFYTCRKQKPFIFICFRFHTFRIPKPLTCISKDLLKIHVIRFVRVISKSAY